MMKNLFLKINMAFIFVVILFANISFAALKLGQSLDEYIVNSSILNLFDAQTGLGDSWR